MDNQSEEHNFGANIDYIPPSLRHIKSDERPRTLCARCTLARWYERGGWNCFCSEFKSSTYSEKGKPVTLCDARELEIIRLKAEQKEG